MQRRNGERHAALVCSIEILAAGDLEASQVKISLVCRYLQWRRRQLDDLVIYAGGRQLVVLRLEASPTRVHRNEPLQRPFWYHMEFGEKSFVLILRVPDQLLDCQPVISSNDRLVMLTLDPLVSVLFILLGLMVKITGSPSLSGQYITAMPLVLENLKDGAR